MTDWKTENVRKSIAQSLIDLQTDYIDLLLIHQAGFLNLPEDQEKHRQENYFFDYPIVPPNDPKYRLGYNEDCVKEAWSAMEEAVREGKVRSIGVSNFSTKKVLDLLRFCQIKPVMNQVELHPFYHQDDALRIMKELGVQPQAWAPLCEGLKNIFSNKILEKTGKKYGKTAAQTALRWNIDRCVSVVTRSSVPEHMREDQDIWDFSLTEAELSAIDQLDLGYSEILDYGNPFIARMFLKKRGIQEEKDDRVIL